MECELAPAIIAPRETPKPGACDKLMGNKWFAPLPRSCSLRLDIHVKARGVRRRGFLTISASNLSCLDIGTLALEEQYDETEHRFPVSKKRIIAVPELYT